MNIVSCNFPAPAVWRQTLLYGTDPQGSVTAEAGLRTALPVYGAWGTRRPGGATGRTAFAGEVRENHDLYRLGNRLYSPRLRRFLSADPLSPFGAGGLNRYAYCGGDPVNRIDPTGNSWLDWLGAALGIVGAVVGTVVTGGALLGAAAVAATGSLAAAMSTASGLALTAGLALDVVSLAAEVGATVALATGDKKAMNILGWVAFGTGLASAGAAMVPRAGKAVARTGRFVGRWQHRLQHAGGRPGKLLRQPELEINRITSDRLCAIEEGFRRFGVKKMDYPAYRTRLRNTALAPVPEYLYRGDSMPLSIVTAGDESRDDRMVLALLHSGRQSGSGGAIQSYTASPYVAERFAKLRAGGRVHSINTTVEGRQFVSTAYILEYHAQRLVDQKLIRGGTVAQAVFYYLSSNEQEYFWLTTKSPLQ